MEFLQHGSLLSASALPLVHSTSAFHLKKFYNSNAIVASKCDIFYENLTYFFVGRPAYKHKSRAGQSAYWELPACFIVEFEAVTDIRRVFPFDSGAFTNGMMPNFIQMMDRGEFEITGVPDAPQKIIGAFFGDASKYFALDVKDKGGFEVEFGLGAFDEELKALHRLACASAGLDVDDRRFCIEVQSSASISLGGNKLMAVICPSIYLDDPKFRHHVESFWKAEPISYAIHSLNYNNYMSEIYTKVEQFYVQHKILSER